jgi:hypothetical protein
MPVYDKPMTPQDEAAFCIGGAFAAVIGLGKWFPIAPAAKGVETAGLKGHVPDRERAWL